MLALLSAWAEELESAKLVVWRAEHELHHTKRVAGVDSARLGTPEADDLARLALHPDVRIREYLVGPDVLPDGSAGEAVAMVRRGDDASLDAAIDDVGVIDEAALTDLVGRLGQSASDTGD